MAAPFADALRRLRRGQRLQLNDRIFKVTGYAPGSTAERLRIALMAGLGHSGIGEDYELVVPQSGHAVFRPVLMPFADTHRVETVLIDGKAPKPAAQPSAAKSPAVKKPTAKKPVAKKAARKPRKAAAKNKARKTPRPAAAKTPKKIAKPATAFNSIQELSAGERFETTLGQGGVYNGPYTLNPTLHRVTWDEPQSGVLRGLLPGATPVRKVSTKKASAKKTKRKASKKASARKSAPKASKKTTPGKTTRKASKKPARKGAVRQRAYKETADGRGGHTPGSFDDEGWAAGVPLLTLQELAPGERFRFRGGDPWTYVGRDSKGTHIAENESGERDEFFGGNKVQLLEDARAAKAEELAAFEERQERHAERLLERAAKAEAASGAAYKASRAVLDHIPMGQPILVGHHSERRHRRDLDRSRRNMDKSIELQRKAERLRGRAHAAEHNANIRSDDPTAIQQLREKVAAIEAYIAKNKAINKAIGTPRDARKRSAKHDERARKRLAELGYSVGDINRLLKPDFMSRVGIPGYEFSNARNRIRQAKARIDKLQREAVNEGQRDATYPSAAGEVRVVQQEGRIRIYFPDKPSATLRQKLGKRGAGFRWAPSKGAWQRMPNDTAWRQANELARAYVAEQGRAG